LINFLGTLGGIQDLLSFVSLWVVGNYLRYYSEIKMIEALYHNTDN